MIGVPDTTTPVYRVVDVAIVSALVAAIAAIVRFVTRGVRRLMRGVPN